MLSNIKDFLAGKKTYLLMLIGIVGALIGWSSGAVSFSETLGAIWVSLQSGALRAAIDKA